MVKLTLEVPNGPPLVVQFPDTAQVQVSGVKAPVRADALVVGQSLISFPVDPQHPAKITKKESV